MKQSFIFLVTLLLSTFIIINANALENKYSARLETKLEADQLFITGYCKGLEDGEVSYEIRAVKTGKAGSSKTSQSGKIKLKQGQEVHLSKLVFSVSAKDSYEIHLLIKHKGKLVAEDHVVHKP